MMKTIKIGSIVLIRITDPSTPIAAFVVTYQFMVDDDNKLFPTDDKVKSIIGTVVSLSHNCWLYYSKAKQMSDTF